MCCPARTLLLVAPILANCDHACSGAEDFTNLLQSKTLIEQSHDQDMSYAAAIASTSWKDVVTGQALLAHLGQTPKKSLLLLQELHMCKLTLPLVAVAAMCALLLVCTRARGPDHEREDFAPPSKKPQALAIPELRLPTTDDPYKAMMPSLRPLISSRMSVSTIPESRMSVSTIPESASQLPQSGLRPPMRRILGSQSSIISGTSASASLSPRSSFGQFSTTAVPTNAVPITNGEHYFMTSLAAADAGSEKSARTPSPFRSAAASAILSPRYSASALNFTASAPNFTHLHSADLYCDDGSLLQPAPRVHATPRGLQTVGPTPRGARASTASQEGVKGVQALVQWYNVGTPRPPDGCAVLMKSQSARADYFRGTPR